MIGTRLEPRSLNKHWSVLASCLLVLAALAALLEPSPAAAYEKRLICGSPFASYTDWRQHVFVDDVAYTAQNGAGFIGGWDAPDSTFKPIGGTVDEQLYKWYRGSNVGEPLEYRFTVPNGTYVVRLHFADTVNHGPGLGIFNVAIEGQTDLSNFDIYEQVRDHYAVLYSFQRTVTDGQLNIVFTAVRRLVQIRAIEVWSAAPDAVPPVVPAGLAVSGSYGRILLDWTDNAEDDIAGYHVERSDSPTGPWQRKTTSLCRRSRFEDTTALQSFPYHYRVIAADVWGNESPASAALPGMRRTDAETDLPIYGITISPSVWETLNLNVGLDTYYPATFTYNGQTWNNVGVRYRGNTSRDVSKKSWKIKFNKFVPNQEFLDGQNELNLDSTFGERTILREKLASDYCELVDVPDFDSRHVQLRVNGEYFGVYVTPENVDKRWLRKHGFDDSGSLYKAELNAYMQVMPDTAAYMAAYSKQTNEATGYADLIQFIELVNNTPANQIYHVLSGGQIRFDIESFINYNAAMVALSTDSFFGRNYFLYHDLLTNTWTYLPDDLDSTFGHSGIFDQKVTPNLNPLHGFGNILIGKLQQSPHVKRRIFERVLEMAAEELTLDRMTPVVDSTFALMQVDAQLDWRKWGWEDPAWTDGGANEIKGYIALRQSFLQTEVFGNPTYMPPQTLFLNEIMADNDSVLADEMGEYEDWIEIVNLGAVPVALGGYHLSDDIAQPTKWAIPDTTLAPGGHIIFWCDMEPLEGPTHTNFRLEKTGEWVGLFGRAADGRPPIDSKSFGRQIKDVSYGRLPDGGYDWDLMGTPTPAAPNLVDTNLPPAITSVDHLPAVPSLNVAVRVTARIEDATGVAAAKVFYRPGATFLEQPMFDDGTGGDVTAGDHIYTAILPGQPAPGVVNYYIWAVDTGGWDYTDPRDAPIDTHAYTVAYMPPDLYVNEFLAQNNTGIMDEFGQREDWVEIYNGGQNPVSLGGLCLSDALAVPNKFTFPDTTIAPGAFLLVWCDNDPEQGPLHADFRLSAAGEQVGLFAGAIAGFAVIDSVSFRAQRPDISRGRLPDGGPDWYDFTAPTPREPNSLGSGVEPAAPAPPRELLLGPGRPNPTSGLATIPFALPAAGRVRLTVYDPSGRAVAELVDEVMAAGTYEVAWDGRRRAAADGASGGGAPAPAGVYFFKLRFGSETRTGKIALLH